MTTTPDSRIAHDWHLDALPGAESTSLPPGVPTRAQAGHLVDQMTPELRAEMEAHWARAQPIDTSTTATPDTSTTAGKVAVMQDAERGKPIQMMTRGRGDSFDDDGWSEPWWPPGNYNFNWERYNYRIAPPPAPRTALQRARDLRSRLDLVDSMAADGILCCLLTDIDYAPVVEVLERRISWDAADLSALPKGRYRLLRDDQ